MKCTAAAHGAIPYSSNRSADHFRIYDRVRIDEHQYFAFRALGAGVARSSDLPMLHLDETSSVLEGDRPGAIRRGIVHHNDFTGESERASCDVDGIQRAGK
jgi:hypothetical protein